MVETSICEALIFYLRAKYSIVLLTGSTNEQTRPKLAIQRTGYIILVSRTGSDLIRLPQNSFTENT